MNDLSQEEHKQILIDLYAKKSDSRGCIAAKCIECIYDPLHYTTWEIQVEKCACMTCPLYTVRPKAKNK